MDRVDLKRRVRATRLAAEYACWRRARILSRDQARSALLLRISEAMELPPIRPHGRIHGSVWAVAMVKNEADIIALVVEHLFRQGVDGVLIADNGSTDGTPALLRGLAERHPLHVATDREPARYQALKTDLLCDWARRSGADWIIPFDADEFWFAPGTTAAGYLRGCKSDIMRAAIHNLFPVAGVEFGKGPWHLETVPHHLVKVAFRSHRYARLDEGNHGVRRPGRSSAGLLVLHVPWRSWDQFRRKTQQGREGRVLTDLPVTTGQHLRSLGALEENAASEVWGAILRGEKLDDIGWSPGGPARLVDPLGWATWDPESLL